MVREKRTFTCKKRQSARKKCSSTPTVTGGAWGIAVPTGKGTEWRSTPLTVQHVETPDYRRVNVNTSRSEVK